MVQDLLMKMPCISSKNVYSVMNRVENLTELVKLSVAELTEILGSSANASLLHEFLHSTSHLPPPQIDTASVAAPCSKAAAAAATDTCKSKPVVRRKSPRKK